MRDQERTVPGCKCPACLGSERDERMLEVPYRAGTEPGHAVFHLLLHLSLPVFGAVLIGGSWWAFAPVLGSLAAYLANSLMLCPSCAYHHADAPLCGCYPKSVFSYKRYGGRRWGRWENITGRSMVVLLTIGPAIAVLSVRGEPLSAVLMASAAVAVLFLTSTVSCPSCRQRGVCYLGMLTTANIRRTNI